MSLSKSRVVEGKRDLAKNMGDKTVQERHEVAESSSPIETHWPSTLLLNENFWERGSQVQ